MSLRPLVTAELLAVGSELTTGQTRETDGGDLARELSGLGVEVRRLTALPDELDLVAGALADALGRVDLVITTGGLGPTPDDLTREAIAAVCGETPAEDPELLAWLEALFARRGRTMVPMNRKQAWLIPSARALANGRGTAPGWWIDRPDGRVIVALPGPPREMAAMWRSAALPGLRARGLGGDRAAATLRLTGIGESDAAALIGEELLRAANPDVATYAREDAVDVRVDARAADGRTAAELLSATLGHLGPLLERWTFARGEEGWPEALARRLGERRVAAVEVGLSGALAGLIGGATWLARLEVLSTTQASVGRLAEAAREQASGGQAGRKPAGRKLAGLKLPGGGTIGLAVRIEPSGRDTAVRIGLADEGGTAVSDEIAFLGGTDGRRRAALAACATLWRRLGDPGGAGESEGPAS
ncbi:MAG TPA: molybdopterin-binding protein [Candidatus Limnocylindrales bacterium]|nr:molybdopterin-binding protein [Candidatus Limnocylindrales bacterium]